MSFRQISTLSYCGLQYPPTAYVHIILEGLLQSTQQTHNPIKSIAWLTARFGKKWKVWVHIFMLRWDHLVAVIPADLKGLWFSKEFRDELKVKRVWVLKFKSIPPKFFEASHCFIYSIIKRFSVCWLTSCGWGVELHLIRHISVLVKCFEL